MDVNHRFLVVTDLLLGAAYADDRLEGEEVPAVRRLLTELLEREDLPPDVEGRIEGFDPEAFDVEASAAEFASDPATSKRTLLELVAAVFDADGEVDFEEDDYMRSLAEALGMDEGEYGDLVIEYDVEDVSAIGVEVIVSLPPPVPKG